MSTTAAQSSSAGLSNSKNGNTFEFTKRKRFADLLITELAEAIVLVLSTDCKVLFCGTAVTELLGWRNKDLVDGNLVELINEEDRSAFKYGFQESLRTRKELLSYVRLKRKNHSGDYDPNPQEVLFELKGHPHFIADQDNCTCLFAVAKPYPSRNTAMLNTFLELKMENEQLQQRLANLRKRVKGTDPSSSSTYRPPSPSMAPTMNSSYPNPPSIPQRRPTGKSQYYPSTGSGVFAAHAHNGMMPSPVNSSFEAGNLAPHLYSIGADEESSEERTKKKLKTNEQHVCVTCGRTDSPEWRKGPQGPKTLCNACGLRWAKQQRKTDE